MPDQNNPSNNQIPQAFPEDATIPPIPPNLAQDTSFPNPTQVISDAPPPEENVPPKKKFSGKMIATILGILVLVGSIGAGIILVGQQQDIREKANVCSPNGQIEKYCDTGSGSEIVKCHQCTNNNWEDQNLSTCSNLTCNPCNSSPPPETDNNPTNNTTCSVGTGESPPPGAQCPDGTGTIVWCATFNCPNGDTDGDGTCNPTPHDGYAGDRGATYTTRSGNNCPQPASNCGQLDYYKSGPEG